MRCEARVGDAVFRCGLGERAISIIDEQQIRAVYAFRPVRAGNRDVYVEKAIVIDVAHRDPGAVVDIDVSLDVQRITRLDDVRERDAGLFGAQELEYSMLPASPDAADHRDN